MFRSLLFLRASRGVVCLTSWAAIPLLAALVLLALASPALAQDAHIATFSIVARDADTGDLGVAVQSKYFGVGAVVPHAAADVGALATQARGNVLYGSRGLDLLQSGSTAAETLEQLLEADPLREERQVGLIAARGEPATFTGGETLPWSGGKTGTDYAVQGNLLAGPEVVEAMAAAFETTEANFPTRMVAALAAGQAAGGDARGRQSAAILVVRADAGYMRASDRLIDLHVEDHPTPIQELYRLLGIRLSQLAVEDAHRALRRLRRESDPSLREAAIAEAQARASEAVELHESSDAGWVALAAAEAAREDLEAASRAARRALLINPVLKRYSVIPETGLGIEPELLERLLADARFRKVWDALPEAPPTACPAACEEPLR